MNEACCKGALSGAGRTQYTDICLQCRHVGKVMQTNAAQVRWYFFAEARSASDPPDWHSHVFAMRLHNPPNLRAKKCSVVFRPTFFIRCRENVRTMFTDWAVEADNMNLVFTLAAGTSEHPPHYTDLLLIRLEDLLALNHVTCRPCPELLQLTNMLFPWF